MSNYHHNYVDLWASFVQAAAGPLQVPNNAALFGPPAPSPLGQEAVALVAVGVTSAAAFSIGDGINAPAQFAAGAVVTLPVRRVVVRPPSAVPLATVADIVLGGAGPFYLTLLAMSHPDG